MTAGANSPRSVSATQNNLPFRAWERSIGMVVGNKIPTYVEMTSKGAKIVHQLNKQKKKPKDMYST